MLRNILLTLDPVRDNYKAKGGPRSSFITPPRERFQHGLRLKNQLENLLNDYNKTHQQRTAASLKTIDGIYLQFVGMTDFDLKTSSLEDSRYGIKLLNVKETFNEENKKTCSATVYVPADKTHIFLNKINKYLDPNLEEGKKPKNKDLIESIQDIKSAYLDAFVTTPNTIITKEKQWYEVWLSFGSGVVINNDDYKYELIEFARQNNLEVLDEFLTFTERCVCLLKANKEDLLKMLCEVSNLAEIRKSSNISKFFLDLSKTEQIEWGEELLSRIILEEESKYSISILDSGLNSEHPLIKPFVVNNGEVAYDDLWGTFDTPNEYHGTAMAGICIYDSLSACLSSSDYYTITHKIENGKILSGSSNLPHLYGYIVASTISKLIINNPHYTRVYCMAVTEPDVCDDGKPSSWSAELDNLCYGVVDNIKKTFIVSAGNSNDANQLINYPNYSRMRSVQSPAQAWNTITVGSITFMENEKSIAKKGELSPYSSTSYLWANKWPIKPDIVFEGGNGIVDGQSVFSSDELSELSTEGDFTERGLFRSFNATSLSTAKAANFAIRIHEIYPEYWPETVRALMIHSASWTPQLERQFLVNKKKKDYRDMLRTCGYGVPSFKKAVECRNNFVNMVIQSQLIPFIENKNNIKLNEYALFEVPWPKDLLLQNYALKAKLKVTLSYFVESNPGELGWKDKYRYASCGLRFSINGQLTKTQFVRTISDYINSDDDDNQETVDVSTGIQWKYGVQARNVGSIHSDVWETTAGELAESRYIAVYPVAGWWKTKKKEEKYNNQIRYSLIVSLEIGGEVNIYNEIVNIIEMKNEININNGIPMDLKH